MNPRETAERMRLLLSWKERLQLQSSGNRVALRRVDRELRRMRQWIRGDVEAAGALLQARLAEGSTGATPDDLDQLRHQIAQGNFLLKANSSADLGGFADLPLDGYPQALGFPVEKRVLGLQRDDFITIVAALFIGTGLCLTIAWYNLWRTELAFHIDRPGPRNVTIRLQNNSSFPIHFVGPWPDAGIELPPRAFGLSLACRPVGSDDLQDCTNLREVWSYQRQALSTRKPVAVESGTSATLVLDLNQLEEAYGEEIAEIQIDCGSPWRKRIARFVETVRPQ